MTRFEFAPEILQLAEELGIRDDAPVEGILAYCRRRVDAWVAESGGVTCVDALESLVTQKLQMVFEEIRTDGDFDRITQAYAKAKKDPVFATMRSKFDDGDNLTYGALVKRRNVTRNAADRFVAVIDCRGDKLARRFFTRWHEIAHRMTTNADIEEPVYRSERDPIERLMDDIAAHIGFYEPLFQPAFQRAAGVLLTFGIVEAVINNAFPAASFQATLFACARRVTTPILYIEAMLAHKKDVRRRLATPSLFGDDRPLGQLRVVKVIPNEAAQQEGFTIPANMRVPADSVIYRLFDAEPQTNGDGHEDLSQWESKGRPLKERAIVVEARRLLDRVICIVQPLEPVRSKNNQRTRGLFDY